MGPNPQFLADLITFIEKILNGKLHFCAACISLSINPLKFGDNNMSYVLKQAWN